MTSRTKQVFIVLVVLASACSVVAAMQRGRRGWRDSGRDARNGVPVWETKSDFQQDMFTFARVQYDDRYGGGRWSKWSTDQPDSDLNFSLRLHQLTSISVNPEPVVVRLDSDEVFDYPFLYIIEPGMMELRESEVEGLRRYCLNGGFVMVDDFWGDSALRNLHEQMRRAFPDRIPQEVPLEHEIFQCVYPLKEKPQIPAIGRGGWRYGVTWENGHDGDVQTPHYQAIYDDEDRIMIFICHNTDLGDGWEEEARDPEYFQEFSVKKAYPLGINIVTYAMTH